MVYVRLEMNFGYFTSRIVNYSWFAYGAVSCSLAFDIMALKESLVRIGRNEGAMASRQPAG